jgi:branched-subunit amino acid aminotransferase/4-amino-4-deoxychorismate lyase
MSAAMYEFTPDGLEELSSPSAKSPATLVADSWRVSEGTVVGLEHHLLRFSTSVLQHTALSADHVAQCVDAVLERLPREGEWFPRIEAVGSPESAILRYHQRPAPPASSEVVLARASHDPRLNPHVKGPDLAALMALREECGLVGADEAIIVDTHDRIVEGAYSSLMVWVAGEDSLTIVAEDIPRLPSVTEELLVTIARAEAVAVRESHLSVADLDGAEVWVVSALHGIRLATSFVSGPPLLTHNPRATSWQAKWRALGRTINREDTGKSPHFTL